MSAPTLPGAQQAGPSSSTLLPAAPATQRAREIQEALKSIVLQTASTLRAKTQLERLQSSVPTSSGSAAASVNESSSSLDKLQGECARYLSLVHGLRDYLLHAQAAIEIELEAATQREAEEAKKTALAAEEALIRQQAAEEEARKKAQEEAERKRVEDEGKAKNALAAGDKKDAAEEGAQGAEGKKEQVGDDSLSGLATPPLPAAPTDDAVKVETGASAQAKKEDPGKAANDAIIIDSDGDDDEDDVPLAFAPKAGANDNASKPIDLTDSPALPNAANPLQSTAASQPADASNTTTSDGTTQDPPITSSLPTEAPAAAVGIPGLDLSAFGINLSSLTNLPDLSSLGIPSLTSATSNSNTSSADPTSLAPARDFAELEKMMGIDLSSATASSSANPTTSTSTTGIPDLSSLGNFNLGSSSGGFGEDTDMFGTSNSGLDLSNFDFSSLTGGAGGADAGASGGVDLSSFLTNFTSNNSGDGGDGTAGS